MTDEEYEEQIGQLEDRISDLEDRLHDSEDSLIQATDEASNLRNSLEQIGQDMAYAVKGALS